jgi:hypothetical protein
MNDSLVKVFDDTGRKPTRLTCRCLLCLMALISIFLVSCGRPCKHPSDITPFNCDKCDSRIFRQCIEKSFPPDSIYQEVKSYLTKIGFRNSVIKSKENVTGVHFQWDANDLSNYGVVVNVFYDKDMRVTYIEVQP